MMTLDEKGLKVAKEFLKENFVAHKTTGMFSGLATDQAHEQNNAVIKDGGAIWFTEDPKALHMWMVAEPEVSRLVHGWARGMQLQ